MPATAPFCVRVRDLRKRYSDVAAIDGVSFEAGPGEIFGLLGPNGAGKTTALECILGLRTPDSGSVAIDEIGPVATPRDAREVCGAQLQGAALQDKISPRRALELFASFYRRPADVNGLIRRFGLGSKADAAFDTLSAGQRQRLFLALAFVNNPGVVVLDEPTTGLDPLSRRELHGLILEFRESGRTIILSTHDMAEAQALCDRVGIIDEGRIVASGTTGDLLARHGPAASLQFRTRMEVEGPLLLSLPGVTACRSEGGLWILSTTSVNSTLAGLVSVIAAGGNEFRDLRITPPTLEDAFLSLTGRRWQGPPGDEA
jgi:ABC-2 type transport system ATP-binding protein